MNDNNERQQRFQIDTEPDFAKLNALAQLVTNIKDQNNRAFHIPDPFFFDPIVVPNWQSADVNTLLNEQCVRGFWGTAPLMFVGSRPSENGSINSAQIKRLYHLMLQHGLANVHITDTIKAIPPGKFDAGVERTIFHEELSIIEPHTVVFFDYEAQERYADYLSVPRLKRNPHSVAQREKFDLHFTVLRFPKNVNQWEANLINIIAKVRQRLAVD